MNKLERRKDFIYNQNVSNKFASDCTVFSILQIFWITYDVWTKYSLANKIVDFFIRIWKLFSWWASFIVIYNATALQLQLVLKRKIKEIEKATWKNINIDYSVDVLKYNLWSTVLEDLLKKW
jgi:hypothetical protein